MEMMFLEVIYDMGFKNDLLEKIRKIKRFKNKL